MQNIYWRDIPASAKVVLVGKPRSQSYVAVIGRKRYAVYWMGNDSAAAQKALDKRVGLSDWGPAMRPGETRVLARGNSAKRRGPTGAYRSRSGQRVFVRYVMGSEVYFQLIPEGSRGNMPLASFKKQYTKDRETTAYRGSYVHGASRRSRSTYGNSAPLDFSTPRRVQIRANSGMGYFKAGQYAYVVAVNTHGGMYFTNKTNVVSKPGEAAYLVSKTKSMRGGALWFSADALRFTSRSKGASR